MDKDTAASREKPLRRAVRVRKGTTKTGGAKPHFGLFAFCRNNHQSEARCTDFAGASAPKNGVARKENLRLLRASW
jgi:hypothetical protein